MRKSDKDLELLSLSYSRYVSRAHTTFSSWVDAIIGITIGYIGIVLSYLQIYQVSLDKFKLLSIFLISIIMAGIITFIAVFIMYHSRIERKDIVRKIKSLRLDNT